jgi:hypothetical protein
MKRRNRIGSCGWGARFSLAVLGAGLSVGLRDASAAELSAGTLPVTGLADLLSPEPEGARARPPSWLDEDLYYKNGAGFESWRELKQDRYPVGFAPQDPLVRKKKRAGLMVEFRF